MTVLLALDQGTTSSRAIVFDRQGKIVRIAQKELTLHYPENGWVEQDAEDIWKDTLTCANEVSKSADIDSIGITNQRETTILWDRETGEPVYNAIVWQDRRTFEYCRELKGQGHEESVTAKTGLLLDPYFSATKIKWILDNVDGVRERAEKGEIAFGTVECFLLWRLTERRSHVTDITNASRTMLFNIHEKKWDKELLKLFDIPESILPEVKPNVAEFGTTKLIGDKELSITGMAGDQHAAMIGQACFKQGMIKSTYGTGCFALMNTGETPTKSNNRLLTTIAYDLGQETQQGTHYAIEGSIFIAGAAIQWMRDNMGFFEESPESEKLARDAGTSDGVVFVPAFTGLGAPYWNPEARAAILGMTRNTNKGHITYAALEAQAFQTHDLLTAMQKDTGLKVKTLRVDGGLVNNKLMCQMLANINDTQVDVPENTECTALGAAMLAGLGSGFYKDTSELEEVWKSARVHEPDKNYDKADVKSKLNRWRNAITAVQSFHG